MISKGEESTTMSEVVIQVDCQQAMENFKLERLDFSPPDSSGIDNGQKRFVCDICDATFTMIGNLNRHKKGHSNHRPYTCDFCLRGFLRRTSYIEHIRLHTGEKPYKCATCRQTFVRKKCHQMHIRKCNKLTNHHDVSVRDAEEKASVDFGNAGRRFPDRIRTSSPDEPLDLSSTSPTFFSSKDKPSMFRHFQLEDLGLQSTRIAYNHRRSPNYQRAIPLRVQARNPQYPKDRQKLYSCSDTSAIECAVKRRKRETSLPPKEWDDNSSNGSSTDVRLSMQQMFQTMPVSMEKLCNNGSKLWPCSFCQIYFEDRTLHAKHMAMHDEHNPMVCAICNRLCSNAHEFLIHH